MANFQSKQVAQDMPVPSHGDASSAKCQHFQVTLGAAGANADTIQFGDLPDYAVPVEAIITSTAAVAGIDVGFGADTDGLFDGVALTANVPLRTALATQLNKNTGRGLTPVVGTLTGVAAVGTIDLTIFYVVEDYGDGYPRVAAA